VSLWYVPSALVLLLVCGGVLGAHLEALAPETGFRGFFWGMGVAALSLLPFGSALLLEPLRATALRALLIPVLVLLVGGLPNMAVMDSPGIHDVTTDPADTLAFSSAAAAGPPEARRASVLAAQRIAYPDLAPLEARAPAAEVFQRAAEVARSMPGWRVTSVDAVRGRIQAHETSRVFRLRDDVVIRVQPVEDGEGARIDVRSRSRTQRSDFGANAARVRAYLAACRASGIR